MARKFDYGLVYGIPYKSYVYDPKNKAENIRTKVEYMLSQTSQMFEFNNLPETINRRDLLRLIQTVGFGVGVKVDGKPYILLGSRGGMMNPQYMPTLAVVANPALNLSETYEIDKECVIIRNDSSYIGLVPLLTRYATELVENEISLRMSIVNTRTQTLLMADDDDTIESAEKYLKDLENGKIGVIANPTFMDSITGLRTAEYSGSTASGNILNLIEYEQYLEGQWRNKLGIRSSFNMKREALGDSEVSQMDMALLPFVDDMLCCLKEDFEKFNNMFGTNIEVSLNSAWANIHEQVEHADEVSEDILEDEKEITSEDTEEEEKEND